MHLSGVMRKFFYVAGLWVLFCPWAVLAQDGTASVANHYTKTERMTPNKVTRVEFTLPDVNHAFLKGHKIMVQIQSSWFPLVDRNPQKFVNIYKAIEADFQKATQRVYRSGQYPSHVTVNVLR